MAVRVLIVDDSFFMRQALEKIMSSADIEVVATAKNGKEAIDKVIDYDPDLVTMDIEMPVMNGIDSLKEIMNVHPVPVMMVSSLTSEGADATE